MKKIIITIAITIVAMSMVNAQLKITSTGTIGIGTTIPYPNSKLDVEGNIYIPGNGNSINIASTNDVGNRLRFFNWGTENYIDYSQNLHYRNGTNEAVFFGSTGKVGIGTTTPAFNLDVPGTTRFGATTTGKTTWSGWTSVYFDWIAPYGMPTLYPQSDGSLMIGTSSSRAYVNAVQVWSTWFTSTSDERVKENITNLKSSLQGIRQLRPVKYDIKKSYVTDSALKKNRNLRKDNIGFLAQEVEKIFPQLVTKTDSNGLYGINYLEMIPIIVDAMKDQSSTIDSLKDLNKILAAQVTSIQNCCNNKQSGGSLKADVIADAETTTQITTQTTTAAAKLYQNAPNPFKESTTIKLDIPQSIGNAMVCIYDLNGRQLKCLTVSGRGITSVQIFGNELTAGLYHYALIADGALIDTKTMVLTN